MIKVKFFASLSERMGRSDDQVSAEAVATVQDVWTRVSAGTPMPAHTLMAVNMEYAGPQQTVRDGDEVAFFPPITGG